MTTPTTPLATPTSTGEKGLRLLVVQGATRFDDAPTFLHRTIDLEEDQPRDVAADKVLRDLFDAAPRQLDSLAMPGLEVMAWFDPHAREDGEEFNESCSLLVHMQRQEADPLAEFVPIYGAVAFTHLTLDGTARSLQPWQINVLTLRTCALFRKANARRRTS